MTPRSLLALALATLPLSACLCDAPPDVPDVDPGAGDGTVVIDGEAQQYAVDFAQSELIIVVENKVEQFGCGLFHSHVVESRGFQADFSLDPADPGASTFSATVPAAGLQPDANELRARFLPNDPELSDGDRRNIKVSVIENLDAEEHPTLTFSARDLTALDGEGSATVDVDIAGATSTITLDFTTTEADGVFTLEGEGVLDGAPHGIPSGFASDCVRSEMDLFLKLVLVPGASSAEEIDAGIVPFEQQTFPYEGDCAPDVAFEEVRQILGPRCQGCHNDPPSLGASVPLVEYNDLRVDSARTVGTPLFETVGEYIQLPATETLHMPPLDVTQLSDDEKQTLLDWIAAGAPDERCDPQPVDPFVHVEPAPCGSIIYDDIAEDFVGLYCSGCHNAAQAALPVLDTYEAGLELSAHPFYAPLNLWEASAARIFDASMFPYAGFEFADDPAAQPFLEWVAQGYPSERCELNDAGPDAGDAG